MHNEDYEEQFDDMDLDIQRKKELIAEAKELSEKELSGDMLREARALQKSYRRIHNWESVLDQDLNDEFEGYMDAVFARQNEIYDQVKNVKEGIIARAAELAAADDLRKATAEMKDLMNQWKAAGSAGRRTDDELWARYQAEQQKFYDRKHENWKAQQERFANARVVKAELIEKAAALADSEDWKKTADEFKSLLDQWKAVGSAGREYEDGLWSQFNGYASQFYTRRSAHYKEVRKDQEAKLAAKRALIEEAREVLDKREFTREQTEFMKNLNVRWKEIGYCGKDHDDQVWKEFRAVMEEYFDGLRDHRDQAHQNWVDRQHDNIAYKQNKINQTNSAIRRLERDMDGLISEGAMMEIQDEIDERKDYIARLEDEIRTIEDDLGIE